MSIKKNKKLQYIVRQRLENTSFCMKARRFDSKELNNRSGHFNWFLCRLSQVPLAYSNSHKDFPKSGEALGQTRASAAHNSEIVYESRYRRSGGLSGGFKPMIGAPERGSGLLFFFCRRIRCGQI
jgi:hypothetical protein